MQHSEPSRSVQRASHETRVEGLLAAPLAAEAVRSWPQSGEVLHGKARIAEVEAHFPDLKLGVARRRACGNLIVVEWSTDYGDGRVYRNVTLGELRGGEVVRVTDYWGEPFQPPAWRMGLSVTEDVRPHPDELKNE